MRPLELVSTPALLLDRQVLVHNLASMAKRLRSEDVRFRPHLKTAKSARVAELATADHFGGITVSTLKEAAYFSSHGFRDITYGVCCVPGKLERVASLQRDGACVRLITDNLETARSIVRKAGELQAQFHVLIEVDSGLKRTGLRPDDPEIEAVARVLKEASGTRFGGVLTHAGHAYHSRHLDQVRAIAEEERRSVVRVARRLVEQGIACPEVSVGSTPTALFAESLEGVTEVRAGTYMFNDLFQAGLQTCRLGDIAISVLATVVSHSRRENFYLIDAGMLALSQDTSAGEHWEQVGYGLVLDEAGIPLEGQYVSDVHQEHGFVRSTRPLDYDRVPIGSRVRIVPNHACSTAAMFDRYHIVDGDLPVSETWDRTNRW